MGHLITLVNASKIEAISLAISITVIVLLFITLAVSLYLYSIIDSVILKIE